MPTRNRAHALTLSVASMAAVLSLTLATPNAGAAPTTPDPTTPSTSAQPTPPIDTTPSTATTQPPTDTPPTSTPSTSEQTVPSSDPAATAPSTSTPSTDTPKSPSTTQARPQARAAVAAGCQTYPPTSYQVCGRIRDKYNQLNGPNSYLLFPKSNELTNPNNTGKRSEFLGGNIYWSTATDAHPVAHDFLTKWGQYGYEGGFMKYPTTDEIPLGGADGRRQEFQGAWMYYSIPTGTHNVQGAILDKYKALGAQASYLGYPTSDEVVTPDGKGRYNIFQNGVIYWSPTTGAHPISGVIQLQWSVEGYEGGTYGYPTSDPAPRSGVGESQTFQKGTLNSIGRQSTDAFYYYTFTQDAPDYRASDTYGSFSGQVNYLSRTEGDEFYYPMAWGIRWSDYVKSFGVAGGNTPMRCKGQLLINGKKSDGGGGLTDKDDSYTLNDTPHSTVKKNNKTDKKVLLEFCSFPDKFGDTSIASFIFNYEVQDVTDGTG